MEALKNKEKATAAKLVANRKEANDLVKAQSHIQKEVREAKRANERLEVLDKMLAFTTSKKKIVLYKKCYIHARPPHIYYGWDYQRPPKEEYIVTLEVPRGTERVLPLEQIKQTKQKVRVAKAKVVAIHKLVKGRMIKTKITKVFSHYNEMFAYEVGKVVTPRYKFNGSIYSTCKSGIHAYRTIAEAKKH